MAAAGLFYACTFELAPPATGDASAAGGSSGHDGSGGSAAGSAGTSGTAGTTGGAGAGGTSGSAGVGGTAGAPADASDAADACAPCGDAGVDCCSLPHVLSATCNAGTCSVGACSAGFVDCDGNPLNGCEEDFGVGPAPAELSARHRNMVLDGAFMDWVGIARVPLESLCPTCGLAVSSPGVLPARSDLAASVRAAWSDSGLYFLVEAYDDEFDTSDASQVAANDGFELFFDGLADRGAYGVDDHHLKVDLTKAFDFAPSTSATFWVETVQQGRCWHAEVQVEWASWVGPSWTGAPQQGHAYGFNAAVNDRDGGQRQSQVYWRNPGLQQDFSTLDFGNLKLDGP